MVFLLAVSGVASAAAVPLGERVGMNHQRTDTVEFRNNISETNTTNTTLANGTTVENETVVGWHWSRGRNTYMWDMNNLSTSWVNGENGQLKTATVSGTLATNNLTDLLIEYETCKADPLCDESRWVDNFNQWYWYNQSNASASDLDDLLTEVLNVPWKAVDGEVVSASLSSTDLTLGGIDFSITFNMSADSDATLQFGDHSTQVNIDTQTDWGSRGTHFNSSNVTGHLRLKHNEVDFFDNHSDGNYPDGWTGASGTFEADTGTTGAYSPVSAGVFLDGSEGGGQKATFDGIGAGQIDHLDFWVNASRTNNGNGCWIARDSSDNQAMKLCDGSGSLGNNANSDTLIQNFDDSGGHVSGWFHIVINDTDWSSDTYDAYAFAKNGTHVGTMDDTAFQSSASGFDRFDSGNFNANLGVPSGVAVDDIQYGNRTGNWTGDTQVCNEAGGTCKLDAFQVDVANLTGTTHLDGIFEAKDSSNATTDTEVCHVSSTGVQNLSCASDVSTGFENYRSSFNMSPQSTLTPVVDSTTVFISEASTNTAPSLKNQTIEALSIGGSGESFNGVCGYNDPDGLEISSVRSPTSGSLTTETNHTARIDGFTSPLDWICEATDFSDATSSTTEINATVTKHFTYTENATGQVNETRQTVNASTDIDIRGAASNLTADHADPGIMHHELRSDAFDTGAGGALTGVQSLVSYWEVDHVESTVFGEYQDNSSTSTLSTQYIARDKQVHNNWSTDLDRLTVFNPSITGTCQDFCSDKTGQTLNGNSKKNYTANATFDKITSQTEIPDTVAQDAGILSNLTEQRVWNQTALEADNTYTGSFVDVDISGTCSTTTTATAAAGVSNLTAACNNATYSRDNLVEDVSGFTEDPDAQVETGGFTNVTRRWMNVSHGGSVDYAGLDPDLARTGSGWTCGEDIGTVDINAGDLVNRSRPVNCTKTGVVAEQQTFHLIVNGTVTVDGRVHINTTVELNNTDDTVTYTDVLANLTDQYLNAHTARYDNITTDTHRGQSFNSFETYNRSFQVAGPVADQLSSAKPACPAGFDNKGGYCLNKTDIGPEEHYDFRFYINNTDSLVGSHVVRFDLPVGDMPHWTEKRNKNISVNDTLKDISLTDSGDAAHITVGTNSLLGSSLATGLNTFQVYYEYVQGTSTGGGGGGTVTVTEEAPEQAFAVSTPIELTVEELSTVENHVAVDNLLDGLHTVRVTELGGGLCRYVDWTVDGTSYVDEPSFPVEANLSYRVATPDVDGDVRLQCRYRFAADNGYIANVTVDARITALQQQSTVAATAAAVLTTPVVDWFGMSGEVSACLPGQQTCEATADVSGVKTYHVAGGLTALLLVAAVIRSLGLVGRGYRWLVLKAR